MKKVINIILGLCIVGMAYLYYGSLMGPIKFTKRRSVTMRLFQRLLDIKSAQTGIATSMEAHTQPDFDTLIDFVKTSQVPIIRKSGNLSDDQMEPLDRIRVLAGYKGLKMLKLKPSPQQAAGPRRARKQRKWQEAADAGFLTLNEDGTVKEFLFSRSTVWVNATIHSTRSHQSRHCVMYLMETVRFEMQIACDTTVTGAIQYSFSAQTLFTDYLEDLTAKSL